MRIKIRLSVDVSGKDMSTIARNHWAIGTGYDRITLCPFHVHFNRFPLKYANGYGIFQKEYVQAIYMRIKIRC